MQPTIELKSPDGNMVIEVATDAVSFATPGLLSFRVLLAAETVLEPSRPPPTS